MHRSNDHVAIDCEISEDPVSIHLEMRADSLRDHAADEQQTSNQLHRSNDHVVIDCEIGKDQVSTDLERLADSLEGKLNNLHSLSEDSCIWQIRSHIRKLNENPYTPKIVSIGPIHHHRQELKDMENDKLRYLREFLGRTRKRLVDFLRDIKNKETRLRGYYGEIIKYGSDDFVKMILLDTVFLLELFLRYVPEFQTKDRLFSCPALVKEVVFDILLLDNQLPIFILNELFMLAQPKLPEIFEGDSLSKFVGEFFRCYVKEILIDSSKVENNFSEAKHFVDLLWLCLPPPDCPDIGRRIDSENNVPSITQLYHFGIKFKLASTGNILDIKFDESKKTLEIPKLIISNMSVHLLRNLQIFESSYYGDFNHVNDYNIILNCLLSTPKDVELLVHAGVVENRIMDNEGLSTYLQELGKSVVRHPNQFYYSRLVMDLQNYCKSRWHEWLANFKQNYLTNPWIFASVLAASVMLILTFLQTLFTIIK